MGSQISIFRPEPPFSISLLWFTEFECAGIEYGSARTISNFPDWKCCRFGFGAMRSCRSPWHMDETFVRIAGRWMYLFRAVDSGGQTVDFYSSETRHREAAKLFLKKAVANSGQSAAARVRPRRSAQLCGCPSTVVGGRATARLLPAAHSTPLQ